MEVAGWCVGPIMDKIINASSDYLDQFRWQTGMKEVLARLRENHPKIQAVVFAANRAQINDENGDLNKWIWQLRDAIDEADDVLDELEYMEHKQQLIKNTEETKKRKLMSFLFESPRKILKIGERVLKRDPNLKRLEDAVQKLDKVSDDVDDAYDVVDELEYMELEKQVTKNKKLRRVRSIMKSLKKGLVKIGERGLKKDPNLKRLEEAVQKLDKVSDDVTTFLHLLDRAKQEQKEQEVDFYRTRETESLPKNDLIGRREFKEFVVQWLRKPGTTYLYGNISLLSIVGHGGMGKTTLLQHVYNDEITEEFDLKMWVCVSNNFDVKKVIADMLECLKKKKPGLDSLEALQGKLMEEVMSKRFLLVLDDVWEEEEERDKSKWENVLAPLASGGFGSKILVTTRTDSVALMFAKIINKEEEIVKLEGLEDDECFQLLNSHAFAGVENPSDDHENLRAIAAEIVKKLSGSPLAAKVIGGILNSHLDEGHWKRILYYDHEIIKLGQNDIIPVLRLSYVYLPQHLKSCFLFCSIFPQDHMFDKDDLVRMWIALGFIQLCDIQGETMEDIGRRYFDVLVKRNFFDKFGQCYKMHDLIHELAQSISLHECLRVEDDTMLPSIIPKTLRHLYVQTKNSDIIKKIGQFKYLHSLILFYKTSNQDLCSTLIEIFKASRCLRLLYIHTNELAMIPEEIEYLKHLRYLKIERVDITRLPRSLSNLYHLQYIIYDPPRVRYQIIADFLPSDINNLSNLRHVELPMNCISSISGVGKLKSLQELNMFDLRDVSGYRIGELENMNDLRKLGINCLENVKDAEEACGAKLYEKRRLTDLSLCWSNLGWWNFQLNENMLDNLQPPKSLRNLSIKRYMGARSAIWMNNVNLLSNIEKIELTDCWEWETLPPFGLLRFLKSLTLSNMPKVKWLESKFTGNDKYRAFPLLEVLSIHRLRALEDWFEAGVAAEDGCLFPCLIALVLIDCPKLKELPSLPPKLKTLKIKNTGWKTLNFCSISNSTPLATLEASDCKTLNCYSISNSTPLATLEVSACPNIISLLLADEIAILAALRNLTITNCPNLISLGEMQKVETTNNCHLMLNNLSISDPSLLLMEPLRSIASLKKLSFEDNDELVSFPNKAEQWFLKVRSSLCELEFRCLKSLESLPFSLESLSSLQKLYIGHGVPMLRELPYLPLSLKYLSIWGCQPELFERYREDGGSDRHKIAHIPHIHISTKY